MMPKTYSVPSASPRTTKVVALDGSVSMTVYEPPESTFRKRILKPDSIPPLNPWVHLSKAELCATLITVRDVGGSGAAVKNLEEKKISKIKHRIFFLSVQNMFL